MNMWIIGLVIAGFLLIGGVAIVNANIEQNSDGDFECSTCGNSCTAESDCGLATCGAVSSGSCGCGR